MVWKTVKCQRKSGKSQGILKWIISGNPANGVPLSKKWLGVRGEKLGGLPMAFTKNILLFYLISFKL